MAFVYTPPPTAFDASRLPDPLCTAEVQELQRTIQEDGVVGLKAAFSRQWVSQLAEDIEEAFREARARPGGAVSRGPERYYVEIHPQQLRGFADLAGHPWIDAVAQAVLGADYRIVEVGFDVPGPGAVNQPWHRDFPSPVETLRDRRLTSLAVNVTAVDTEQAMGPFEIAPGTQWDPGTTFEHEMFPPKSAYARYQDRAQRKYPRMGDLSIRSALTIHRGTANHSQRSRPVLVLGLDGPEAGNIEHHDLAVTPDYLRSLPSFVREHLVIPVVDELTPITQKHTIEGLVMGET